MSTIAIVDDDIYIGNMLEQLLTDEGYRVMRAYSGTEAIMLFDKGLPDLVLLDLMLPGLSGEELLPFIKEIPVIIISAKVDVTNKVNLLMEGASDYVTKPFDTGELLARIYAQLRKKKSITDSSTLTYDDIVLDLNRHLVFAKGTELHLTKTEYAILKVLMSSPTQVVTKTALLDKISEDTPDCMENSLRVHISNLRKKLKQVSDKEYIESVWGIGFKMK